MSRRYGARTESGEFSRTSRATTPSTPRQRSERSTGEASKYVLLCVFSNVTSTAFSGSFAPSR